MTYFLETKIRVINYKRYKGKGKPCKSDYDRLSLFEIQKKLDAIYNQIIDNQKGEIMTITDKEILSKAIAKAALNGYDFPYTPEALLSGDIIYGGYSWIESIIFSHDFGKAFWIDGSGRYQQHKMLDEIQEGRCPLKYLRRFL